MSAAPAILPMDKKSEIDRFGDMEQILRVSGWVEAVGGTEKMRKWCDFLDEMRKKMPK